MAPTPVNHGREPPPARPPGWRGLAQWRLPDTSGWRLGAVTYAVTQAVLLFWWVAFYPGTQSYDAVMYVWQATTGNWNTQHSVVYVALVWLSLQLTGSLGALTLLQTVAMAGGLAYVVTGLRSLRVPGRWLAIAACLAVCLPAIGTFTVYVSKDMGFVLAQVWLLGTVARILAARPHPRNALWLALLAELVLMGLLRQNGFIVVGLTGAGLVVALAGLRWRTAACAAAAIGVAFAANLVVYPALGVPAPRSELALGTAYADIAVAYAGRPGEFTTADREVMARVAPLDFWSASANCYDADSTVSTAHPEFNFAAARANAAELVDLWVRLGKRMPDAIIEARLCRGSIGWNPFPGPANGWTRKIPIADGADFYGFPRSRVAQIPFRDAIGTDPLITPAHELGVFLRKATDARSLEWIAWRGATWSYVAYLAVFLFARRVREFALVGLVAVVLANQVSVMANNPAPLVRYMAGPLILGIVLLPLAFVTRQRLEAPKANTSLQ